MYADIAALAGFITALVFIILGIAWFSKGSDETWSLSNVQLILWSGVILGSYLSLAILKGGFLADLSPNLLALLGVSSGSFVAAKGIRTVQEQKRVGVAKPASRAAEKPTTMGLLSAESNSAELSVAKLQMFAWTIVSLTIFIVIVALNIMNNKPELPDIGSGLLVLMGVSHSAYIGNKIADKPIP